MEKTLTLPDGRLLDIYVSGPEQGLPLVFHHGTPGSRRPESGLERVVHARGLRYVCASRPGYGGSTRLAGRRVADVVADTAALLGALGASECWVAGHSGGGPHALACAHSLEGVLGTLVIAGVGPAGVPELDFTAGMGDDNVVEFGLAFEGESVLRPALEAQRPELITADAAGIAAAVASLLPDVDLAVMNDEIGADLVGSLREGLRDGVAGWVDDDLAFTSSWGFSVSEISSPVTLWQGDADLMVPFAHGQWLAGAIPGVDAKLLPGEGHLSIAVGMAERMLDALLALA
ncbi:MAG TPA: alpha/beta hydrolase [Solirubrobacteraceae bacterium]|nr:alpha/beta hydrolase [Solirubrobacteraceae bacterium]